MTEETARLVATLSKRMMDERRNNPKPRFDDLSMAERRAYVSLVASGDVRDESFIFVATTADGSIVATIENGDGTVRHMIV